MIRLLVVVAILTFPIWTILWSTNSSLSLDVNRLFPILFQTTSQSLLSAFFATGFGLIGALGVSGIKRLRSVLNLLILLPNFFPVLFVILISLRWIHPFPFGLAGIVFLHVLLNIGLVTYLVSEFIEFELTSISEIAEIYGISKLRFVFQILVPLSRPVLYQAFLTVFALSFSSFAIPLIVSGGRWLSLETSIYETIVRDGNWGLASGLALIQSLMLFIFVIFKPKRQGFVKSSVIFKPPFFATRFFMILPIGVSLFFLFGWAVDLVQGLGLFQTLYSMKSGLYLEVFNSVFVGLATALTTFFLLWLSIWPLLSRFGSQVLNSVFAPSVALFGFAILFLSAKLDIGYEKLELSLLGISLAVIQFPFLLRMSWVESVQSIQDQVKLAQVFGATKSDIFWRITLPCLAPVAGSLAGLSVFWAVGDFALTKMIVQKHSTLGSLAMEMMSSYRLEGASWLFFIIFAIGMTFYVLLRGLGRVCYLQIKN